MYDVTTFPLRDLTACGAVLRKLGTGRHSLEETAQAIVAYLYGKLRDGSSERRACALVRFFVTRPYEKLDAELQACARRLLADQPTTARMKCLVLAGTAGLKPEWCAPSASIGHRAIPLGGAAILERSPMISQLIRQFGLEAQALLEPDPALLVDLEQKSYNVFHVPDARGSPYVPAQESFVIPYGIRSVVGFGGLFPSGNLFAVILFTTVPIPRQTADLFRPLALSVKLAVLPFEHGRTGGR
jgi:hypothetical protein